MQESWSAAEPGWERSDLPMEVASCSPSAIPAGRTVQLLLTQFGGRDPCPAAADPRRNAINTDGISQLCCAAPAPCASRCGCYQGTRLPSARQGGPAVTACMAPTDNPQPRLSLRWLQRVPLAARSPGGQPQNLAGCRRGGLSLFPQPPRAPQLAPVPLPTGRPQQPSGFACSPGSGELLSPSPCSPLPTPGLGLRARRCGTRHREQEPNVMLENAQNQEQNLCQAGFTPCCPRSPRVSPCSCPRGTRDAQRPPRGAGTPWGAAPLAGAAARALPRCMELAAAPQ